MKKYIVLMMFGSLLGLGGCQTPVPKDVLKPDASVLSKRVLQTRTYDTVDEKKILSASAAALQDMGFVLDESETKLGLIVASKEADATDKRQVALATAGLLLGAMSGNVSSHHYDNLDHIQKVGASLVTYVRDKKTFVRITFQRVVWNKVQQITKMETLNDPRLYQSFFEHLSKSVFLEDHQI